MRLSRGKNDPKYVYDPPVSESLLGKKREEKEDVTKTKIYHHTAGNG